MWLQTRRSPLPKGFSLIYLSFLSSSLKDSFFRVDVGVLQMSLRKIVRYQKWAELQLQICHNKGTVGCAGD